MSTNFKNAHLEKRKSVFSKCLEIIILFFHQIFIDFLGQSHQPTKPEMHIAQCQTLAQSLWLHSTCNHVYMFSKLMVL